MKPRTPVVLQYIAECEGLVLWLLGRNGPLDGSELALLAQQEGMNKSWLRRMVTRLIERGYVRRDQQGRFNVTLTGMNL